MTDLTEVEEQMIIVNTIFKRLSTSVEGYNHDNEEVRLLKLTNNELNSKNTLWEAIDNREKNAHKVRKQATVLRQELLILRKMFDEKIRCE